MRDDFTEEVKRALAARVGNLCSNPDCRVLTRGPQDDPAKGFNVGVAAQITGAESGGRLYGEGLSAKQHCHPDNGIWLCQNCAELVDNDPTQYPEGLLRAWKAVAEHRARSTRTKTAPPESESQRKARAILPWKGRIVTLSEKATGDAMMRLGPEVWHSVVQVLDCTEYDVTVGKSGAGSWSKSISLENIVLCRDVTADQLELQVMS